VDWLALKVEDLPPQNGRRSSLSRFPLIDDGFTSGANAFSEGILGQASSIAQPSQLLVIVFRELSHVRGEDLASLRDDMHRRAS